MSTRADAADARREAYDDLARAELAAYLVAKRIVANLSYRDLAKRMGYMSYRHLPRWSRFMKASTAWYWVPRKMRRLEASLPDARLSTLQRYARAVELKMGVDLIAPPPASKQKTNLRHSADILRQPAKPKVRKRRPAIW